ncbi:hypothetical protein QBC43DRAFT_79063 [Cladorrhinum sp. PSN259]|nr:hypothetical protein QBC43DRAFT_79063 [Cladorrhinum sp. PSN259]
MHGHGENPYLCTYKGCERSVSGHGFPRQWNLRDHMRRVHNGNDAEEKQSSEASDKANNSPAYHPPMSVTSHGSFELGSQNEMDLEQPEGIPLRKETTSPEKQAYESSDDESADIAYRRYTRDESPDSSTSIANQEHTANVVADGSQSVSIETEKPTKVAAWAEAARAEATKNDAQDTIKKREQPVIKPQPDYSDRDVGSVGARREKGKQKEEDKPPDGDGDLDYHSAEETALLGQEATASRAAEQVAKVKELQEETMAALEKAIKEQEEKLAKALEKRKKIQKERQAGEEAKAAAEKRAAEEGDVDKGISDRLAREMAEAVTRWNAKEAERDARERAEKEAADKEFRRRLFEEFRHSGLSETEIEAIMKKEVAKWRAEEQKLTEQIPESNRPTFTRMSLRHLEIETLNFYKVDWEWDAVCGHGSY